MEHNCMDERCCGNSGAKFLIFLGSVNRKVRSYVAIQRSERPNINTTAFGSDSVVVN